MPQASQFKIASIQFSLFTPGLAFYLNKVLAEILPDYKGVLDGEILTLPVPEDAPSDIPRLIMSSQDKKLKLEVSPSRMNFSKYIQSPEDQVAIPDLIDLAKKISTKYLHTTSAIVRRMAIIFARYVEENSPGEALAHHFCQERWVEQQPFNRPENFEIHAHKKFDLSGYNVNSWVRCKTGMLTAPSREQQRIILVEQDINTLAEDMDKKEYKIDDIVGFWETSIKELDVILNLYFPSVQDA